MQIRLDLAKSIDENAKVYFEEAKKARRKLKGVDEAINRTKAMLATAATEESKKEGPRRPVARARKREWYEKFRWFLSSDGFLCIGGRDATTNEMLIKKHTVEGDWVFHTDMAGSSFVVVKTDGKDVPDATMEEAAQFTSSCSRAWKSGLATLEVFYVRPDQVTKEARAGEFLPRGAFMIRGKTTYKRPRLGLAACMLKDGRFMVGPETACRAHAAGPVVLLAQGSEKASDVAKTIQRLLCGDAAVVPLDEIVRSLPPGGVKITR